MLNETELSQILGLKLPQVTIDDIHWKAQESTEGSLLFYKIQSDTHSEKQFVERINKASFAWLILNKDHPDRPAKSVVISEEKWPLIQKKILDSLYPLPSLKMLAITGTNGKTTTTDLVLQLGALCGKNGLSIGTLGVRENQKTLVDFGLTTPGLIDLRKFLALYGKGKDFCVVEASSHALAQDRFHGISFDMAGWLSFSQDHLDYHQTMDDYFMAKIKLVEYLKPESKIFVPFKQEELFSRISSITDKAAVATKIEKSLPVFFSSFNRNNLEVAVAIIEKTFKLNISEDFFEKLVPPDGRFFIKPYKTNYIIVDFAHSPDALENICQSIKETFPQHKLKILFGCGGDRDRTKRPLMGKIASKWADEIYVTSDNPRNENPEQIISDIIQGVPSGVKSNQITDRPEAILSAFQNLGENEILLLAGKGHEDYILKNGVKYPHSDINEVEKFIGRKDS